MGLVSAIGALGLHNLVVAGLVLAPFLYYWYLWTNPQRWVHYCGPNVDPSHRMAEVALVLKAGQILGVLTTASISGLPPWYCVLLFAVGQGLNYR